MASLSIGGLDDETVRRLRVRASREGIPLEEAVRRVLRAAAVEEPVGAMICRIVGSEGSDLELPAREMASPIDFSTDDYAHRRASDHVRQERSW